MFVLFPGPESVKGGASRILLVVFFEILLNLYPLFWHDQMLIVCAHACDFINLLGGALISSDYQNQSQSHSPGLLRIRIKVAGKKYNYIITLCTIWSVCKLFSYCARLPCGVIISSMD
jgi:hypothetical protein